MADNNLKGFSFEEALGPAPTTKPTGFSFEEALTPAPEPTGFSFEEALGTAPEVDDGRGLFSQMGKGFQGFEFGTVAPTIGLQAESGVVAKGRQYLGAYTQLEQGATAKDLALASEGALNLEQLQRYEEGTEEERQKLREFSETTSKKATTRTLDRLGALAESEARTREFAPAVAGITDVKSLADFRDWLGYSIGAGSKQILPIMGAGFVAGPSGALGVGTALAATETIGNRLNFIQDIVKDLPPDEQATAIAEYLEKTGDTTTIVALTSGSLDLAGPVGSLLRRRLTKDLGKEVVERTGLDILKGIPKELGKDMLEEGITGALQETTQLAGKRATGEQTGDLITKENIKDIVDAAAAEAAGGIAGTSINVGADVLRQRAIKARRRSATQTGTRPEWTPVVSAYANMDMGKTEEEIYTRVGEVIADFGNEAATAYLSQVYGIEYTPPAEQEVEVLKGPGQIDSEPVELVSQVLDDVENSEWLADLDSEREATFQAAAELEEVGAEEVEAASIATMPADDMFGFDVPAATQDTGFEPTRNRLMAKLNKMGAQQLDPILREAGLQVTGTKEQKIERLIASREVFDLLTENGEKKYESAVQISQAIQSGEINAEDAARLVNAISVGQKSRTSYVAADTNANALAALIGRLKPSLAVPFRTEAEEAAFQAGREPATVVPGEEAATARAREDEFFENSRLEFLQFWEQATPSDRLELLQAAGAEGNTAGKTSRRVNAKTIDALPNESKILLREWAPDNWNTFKTSPRTGTAVPTAKLGRPVGTGQQSDTAVELRKQQDTERQQLGRAPTALAATLEMGEQKILDKRVARNKTIKFSDYFPTIEEFNQYTNNQQDAYDTEVKGLKLQYATEGVAPEAAQTRAQVDANQKQIAANLLSDELQKLKAKRVKQLEKVIAIATDTKLEGKAAHTAALEVLNDPNIDPQERALAEDNVAATKAKQKPLGAIPAKTGPTPMELLNIPETEGLATQEPLFGAIEEVETAEEAADTIIIDPNRTPFERGLARVLKPILQKLGTTFVIVKDPAQITNPNIVEIWATVDGKQISAGVFDPTNNVIYVDEVEGLQPRVVLHEMIHAATVYTLRRYFNGEAISENAQAAIDSMIVIMDSVGQYYQTLVESGHNTPELDKYYENTDGFNDLEEFVTYGLTGPALQTMLLNMAPVSKPQLGYIRTAFSNFAEAIGRLIGRPAKEYSAFEELIDLTGRVAAETMRNPTKNAGKVVQAKAKVKKQNAAQKAQAKADTLRKFTNKSKGIVNATRNPKEGLAQFKAMFEAMGSKVKRASLAMLTGNMLTSLGDTYKIRAVRKVNNFIDRLKEFRNDKINKFLPNLDKWSVLTRDHKDTSETLEDVINLSTLFDVLIYDTDTKKLVSMAQSKLQDDGRDDVKTPEYPQGRPTGLKSIKFDLQQLSKNPNPDAAEQQEMDRLGKLFQEREAEIEEVFALFDKMKALGGGSTAVELYSWALQEYRNDFEEQYSLLLNSIRSDTTIEGTENDAASPKGKLMADIVASYQEARTRKVYAPLMRFGDWGVRVNPGSKDTAFYMFKNEAQQIQFMNFYQDQNPNDTVVAVSLNQEGRSFRDEMVADTERLRSMFNQIDALSQGNAEVADELKDSIYQIYLLTLPEGNMRKKYLRRKGRLGFDNDAFRALVTTKLSNINQLSRMKYGKDIRNAISEGREAIKDGPTKFQISRDPKKYKGEKPKESKEAILNEVALRATTELAPPVLKGWAAGFDRFTRLGTKSAFVWLMSAPSSALIQPTQLAMFGFGVLHAEFGAGKTAAMAAKYIKNFLTMQALTRTKVGENGNIENEKGQAAIRNSRYVNGSKIKVPLQKAWDIANLQNTFGASLTQDVLSLRDPEEIQARAERGPIARGVSRPVDFTVKMMTGATQLLERVSREVFFMSAFELAYEQALKAGATGDGAIEAAAYRAIKLTDKAMFDYSNQNKPRIAKTSVGRMAYQFQTYRIQATGYLIKNGYNAIFNSDLSPDEKRKAGVMFFDSLAMNAISSGLIGTLGYTAFVALVDGIREALRPEYDDEDEDGMLYDMTDPNNPFGLRSFDLYVRGSFIPRYFGPGSSLAKLLGLEEENARLLARSVEVGPISALTDWNIQPRISFDAMWFTDYGQKPDLYSAAIEQSIFDIAVGPFGSVLKNMADGAQMMLEGEIYRGVEKMSPGFVKEPMEAYRLSQEGYVTVGGNRYAPADYYDAWRLTGQTLGFGSTELARSQKAIFAYQELKQEAKDNKTELYNAVEEAATRNLAIRTEYGPDSKQAARAKARLDDVVNDIRAHNYKYFYNAIKWEDLGASLQEKMRRAGLTKSGLYLGDAEAPYLYPLIQDMLLQPTMQTLEKMKDTEDLDRAGEIILPDVGTGELRE
jgi:hypothetical protein